MADQHQHKQNKAFYLQSTKHQFGDKLVVEPLLLLSCSSKSCLKNQKLTIAVLVLHLTVTSNS